MTTCLVIDLSTLCACSYLKNYFSWFNRVKTHQTHHFSQLKPTKPTIFPLESPQKTHTSCPRYHGSNAMSSAQEAMQIAAEALHQQWPGIESISVDLLVYVGIHFCCM